MSTTEIKARMVDGWASALSDKQKRSLIIALVLLVSEQDNLSVEEAISQLEPHIKYVTED